MYDGLVMSLYEEVSEYCMDSSGSYGKNKKSGGSLTEQNPFLGIFSARRMLDQLGYVNTNIQDYSTTISEECTINNSWVGYNCIFTGVNIWMYGFICKF